MEGAASAGRGLEANAGRSPALTPAANPYEALRRFHQEIPYPTYTPPAKQGVLRRVLEAVLAGGVGFLNPQAGAALGHRLSPSGREEAAQQEYQGRLRDYQAREADEERRAGAEAARQAAERQARTAPTLDQQIANAAARDNQAEVDRLTAIKQGELRQPAEKQTNAYTDLREAEQELRQAKAKGDQAAIAAAQGKIDDIRAAISGTEKPRNLTNPFEAFAYGTPQERQAAQDFLDLEKRLGNRYRNRTEFEERYNLFKEDPETYRAMFGDKSGTGPDRATAARMLNYFDRRRREVQGDFTLDDDQKQEQLREIENLERPFLEAVQPGTRGGGSDRVRVIAPDGTPGTVPRSQLDAAKKKGYRLAQ